MQIVAGLLALGLLALALPASAQESPTKRPRVALETSKGTIVLELHSDKTPKTVENFLAYVESGFFDGTVFHRVIDGFMIQGGGYTGPGLELKETRPPVVNESQSGLSNERGTVAMARRDDPNSASSQFFINTANNARGLDYRGPGTGYTAFGEVVEGMDVVDAISKVETGPGPHPGFQDVPKEPVVIRKATVVKDAG